MQPSASRALRLLLLASLVVAAPSLAAEKLDLSPYLGGTGTPGDFRVFSRSTGGQRKVTLLSLEVWKKGWKGVAMAEVTGAGDLDGTQLYEGYLIPGKQLLDGNVYFENGLAIVLRKPAKGLKLWTTLGKAQRIKQKGRLQQNGVDVASSRLAGEWLAEGFETVTTPSGSYEEALRAQAVSLVTLENRRFGVKIVELDTTTLWYAAGVGLVKRVIAVEGYENGTLVFDQAWTEELSSGRSGGVPFP
jgi:hypothetical protein